MNEAPQPAATARPWGEAIATFLVCALLGPPIGGLVFAASMALMPSLADIPQVGDPGAGSLVAVVLFVALFAVPFSFFAGGLQAVAVGLALAVYGFLRGRPPLWFAVLTAVAVFIGAKIGGVADTPDIVLPMMLVHAVPVLLCWLIIRTFWRERRA